MAHFWEKDRLRKEAKISHVLNTSQAEMVRGGVKIKIRLLLLNKEGF